MDFLLMVVYFMILHMFTKLVVCKSLTMTVKHDRIIKQNNQFVIKYNIIALKS